MVRLWIFMICFLFACAVMFEHAIVGERNMYLIYKPIESIEKAIELRVLILKSPEEISIEIARMNEELKVLKEKVPKKSWWSKAVIAAGY